MQRSIPENNNRKEPPYMKELPRIKQIGQNWSSDSLMMLSGTVFRGVAAVVLCVLTLIARALFSGNPSVADGYGELYRYVAMLLSGALSYIPFCVAEMLLYIGIAGIVFYLGWSLFRMLTTPARFARGCRIAANFGLTAALLWFCFMLSYGFAYYSTPLAGKISLDCQPQEVTALYDTTLWLMDECNANAAMIPRDENGSATFGSFDAIAARIASGFDNLGDDYKFLRATLAPVKRVRSWYAMSSFGITGIYIPYTAEAAVNPDNTIPALPFTMAHEMAHRLMIAPEDEANFVAFVACRANSDRRVRYSAYFMAYRYCINALYAADADLAYDIMVRANPQLNHDLEELNALIMKYETPVKDIGTAVNDGYLKANAQPSGVQSYGEMVDLLVALHIKESG